MFARTSPWDAAGNMNSCAHCGSLNLPEATLCGRCAEPFEGVAPIIAIGQILDGRYRIDEFLGAGGMGQVFAATELRLERPVALKILNAELLRSPKARERMQREAKALARIEHPNVVRINTMFDHEGMLVLDLELVRNGTLASHLREGPMATPKALEMMKAILSGLEALHTTNLVHRDLKPANVLLGPKEIPKIADLGISRDRGSRAITKTGTRLGTTEYMSPEQVRGHDVDHRADIYACGIMLYEMFTGEVPFRGRSDYDVEHGHVSKPPDLERLRARASPEIVSCVARALEKAPGARWESAAALARALDDVGRNVAAGMEREREAKAAGPPLSHRPAPSEEPPRREMPLPELAINLARARVRDAEHQWARDALFVCVVVSLACVTAIGMCSMVVHQGAP